MVLRKVKISLQGLLTGLGVLVFSYLPAQLPTYTIDNGFNSGQLFRAAGSVGDFHFLEDGRILVVGGFSSEILSGFAMIYSDGSWDNSFFISQSVTGLEIIAQDDGYVYPGIYGFAKKLLDGTPWIFEYGDFWSDYNAGGTNNPYNLQRAWDIFQQENGDLLIAGAIGTDTLQPGILRGLTRIHADGTHDPTFPEINITPNNPGGAIRNIYKAPDGSWYVSGSFTALNGHETVHVAHLTADFQVDTEFTTPFAPFGVEGFDNDIILVDSQSRIWVSGYQMRLAENPNDTIQLCRLLPDGSLDASFPLGTLSNEYPSDWTPKPNFAHQANELEAHPGNYLIYGSFSHYNNIYQPCMVVVDEFGEVQDHFFQGQGATFNTPYDEENYFHPGVYEVEELDNGDLLIGGAFSEFMGQTHYSLVKLNPGFLSTEEESAHQSFKIYPNPAQEQIAIQPTENWVVANTTVQIRDASGRLVLSQTLELNRIDISKLVPGLYLIQAFTSGEPLGTAKLVVE